jgi:hypothetical protein
LAYAILNFVVDLYMASGGVPAIHNGQYVLESHGKIIRVLSAQGFKHHLALETRMFSGHWIFFYVIPFLYLTCGRRSKNPTMP